MRSSIAPTAAAAALLLTLTACGSGGDGTADGGTGATAGGLTGSGSGESCEIETPIPIGAVVSLTGAAGSYGESQSKGLELAAAELNAAGGVTYDLTIEDDATDPRQGITVFEQFIAQDEVSLIIGPTLSNTA